MVPGVDSLMGGLVVSWIHCVIAVVLGGSCDHMFVVSRGLRFDYSCAR